VFDSVVAGAFQITFRAKMHANDVFLFFKNHFWHQHIKMIQNIQTILNFSNKKKIKFFGNAAAAVFPNVPLILLMRFDNIKTKRYLAGLFSFYPLCLFPPFMVWGLSACLASYWRKVCCTPNLWNFSYQEEVIVAMSRSHKLITLT